MHSYHCMLFGGICMMPVSCYRHAFIKLHVIWCCLIVFMYIINVVDSATMLKRHIHLHSKHSYHFILFILVHSIPTYRHICVHVFQCIILHIQQKNELDPLSTYEEIFVRLDKLMDRSNKNMNKKIINKK
ncbi:hypothetical protein H8356DRAFT_1073280 [Neocallimastix lanati (nom. inval.)]|nr:hypothetical protein H8356DRAFT_1073280 [Neocallimastix sp. JGI-2020a]